MLVLDYYGRRHNLEIFSTICMIGAVSAVGPALGGLVRDAFGGFGPIFNAFAALNGVVLLATLFMRPPHRRPAEPAARHIPDRRLSPEPQHAAELVDAA